MTNHIYNRNAGSGAAPVLYPNARDPDWADVSPSGIETWVENLDGAWLLRIQETEGTTMFDSSETGFDFDVLGSPVWDDTPIYGTDPAVSFEAVSTAALGTLGPIPTTEHSFVIAYRRGATYPANAFLIDMDGSVSGRFIIGFQNSQLRIYANGAYKPATGIATDENEDVFMIVTVNATEVKLYRFGMLMHTWTTSQAALAGDITVGLGRNYSALTQLTQGEYGVVGMFNRELTPEECRQMSLDYEASPDEDWWYQTKIVDAGLAANAYSCAQFETGFKRYWDCTGNENTPVVNGTSTSDFVEPLEAGTLRALEIRSSNYLRIPSSGADAFTVDWTARLALIVPTSLALYNGAFSIGSHHAYGISIQHESDGSVTCYVRNVSGTFTQTTATGVLSADQLIGIAIRHDASANTVDWWLDGVKQTPVVYTSSATTLTGSIYFGSRYSSYSHTKRISVPYVAYVAESDAVCEAFSTITAP